MVYLSGQEIIDKYDELYKPVFSKLHLFYIFNDEHDYELKDEELSDENIMLAMGHYFSLEENDLNKAKYYYDRVTKLNSAYGLYSLAVFFYTKNMLPRARLHAINGFNLNTKGSTDCAMLLYKISIDEKKYDNAEKYLIDEIERIGFDAKVKTIEILCFFYLNILKDETKLVSYVNKHIKESPRLMSILAKYYYDKGDATNLAKYAEQMMTNKMIIGNYFMGLSSYLQFSQMYNGGTPINSNIIDESVELLDIAELWFESVVVSDEVDNLKTHSVNMIKKISNYKTYLEQMSQQQLEVA